MPEPINVVEILDKLFAGFDKAKSFKKQIEDGVELRKIEGRNETAWQSLRCVLDVIQQIRNSGIKETDDNFLYSPVRGKVANTLAHVIMKIMEIYLQSKMPMPMVHSILLAKV